MGNRIDSNIKSYKDGALVNVCNGTDIFALNLTFFQIFCTGITQDTFNIRFYRNVSTEDMETLVMRTKIWSPTW